jgi:DNA-binding response OmpR family regulator
MTCSNCIALRAKVERLELELGHRRRHGEIGAVMTAFNLTAQPAKMVLALYRANGRPVSHDALLDEIVTASGADVIRVLISRVRASGLDIITHSRVGYALAPAGLSRVLAALEPVALQPVRGDPSDPGDVV